MEKLNQYLKDNPALMHLYLNLKAQLDRIHRHARQGAYATRARYYCAMLVFLKFLAVAFRMEKLANMSGIHLAAYIEWRQECGISPATIKSELCAIRYYHDQMPAHRHPIPSNNALSINLEQRRFGTVDCSWTADQLDAFVALARDKGEEDYARLFILAYELGLRIHESFRIDRATAAEAIRSGELVVKGKGGKIRSVPLTRKSRIVFIDKLAETALGEKLFVPRDRPTHLEILALQQFIIRYRDEVQGNYCLMPLTYHGLRHAYAANRYRELKKAGRSDFEAHLVISRLLGHERADITDIYLVGIKNGWDHD